MGNCYSSYSKVPGFESSESDGRGLVEIVATSFRRERVFEQMREALDDLVRVFRDDIVHSQARKDGAYIVVFETGDQVRLTFLGTKISGHIYRLVFRSNRAFLKSLFGRPPVF